MNKLTVSQRNIAQHIPVNALDVDPPHRKGRHIVLRPFLHIRLQTSLPSREKLDELVVFHPRERNLLVVVVDNVDNTRLFEVTVSGDSSPAARVDTRFSTSMRLAVEVPLSRSL